MTRQASSSPSRSWRERLERLLAGQGTGLTITVDEVHAAAPEELRQLTADVQHVVRDGLPISLVMAGLPRAMDDVLLRGEEPASTFLRRAERIRLDEPRPAPDDS